MGTDLTCAKIGFFKRGKNRRSYNDQETRLLAVPPNVRQEETNKIPRSLLVSGVSVQVSVTAS